jgi:hypothetical protein
MSSHGSKDPSTRYPEGFYPPAIGPVKRVEILRTVIKFYVKIALRAPPITPLEEGHLAPSGAG